MPEEERHGVDGEVGLIEAVAEGQIAVLRMVMDGLCSVELTAGGRRWIGRLMENIETQKRRRIRSITRPRSGCGCKK